MGDKRKNIVFEFIEKKYDQTFSKFTTNLIFF